LLASPIAGGQFVLSTPSGTHGLRVHQDVDHVSALRAESEVQLRLNLSGSRVDRVPLGSGFDFVLSPSVFHRFISGWRPAGLTCPRHAHIVDIGSWESTALAENPKSVVFRKKTATSGVGQPF
jgi:hypothetical protein